MASELLKFRDGVLVEIDKTASRIGPVSNSMATKATSSLEDAVKHLEPFSSPICSHVRNLAQANDASSAEVTIGLSFTAEGNMYIVKGTAEASVEIKLVLKVPPKNDP